MRFDSSGNITVVELVSSRITQNSDENNYIDCKTVRIFALVANDIVLPLRAKDLERDANVEWVLLHPVRDSRLARALVSRRFHTIQVIFQAKTDSVFCSLMSTKHLELMKSVDPVHAAIYAPCFLYFKYSSIIHVVSSVQ